MTWQPIETAPRDGTRVLIFGPVEAPRDWHVERMGVCLASWDYDEWTGDYAEPVYVYQPTHWMPLPEPPEGAEHSGGMTDRRGEV